MRHNYVLCQVLVLILETPLGEWIKVWLEVGYFSSLDGRSWCVHHFTWRQTYFTRKSCLKTGWPRFLTNQNFPFRQVWRQKVLNSKLGMYKKQKVTTALQEGSSLSMREYFQEIVVQRKYLQELAKCLRNCADRVSPDEMGWLSCEVQESHKVSATGHDKHC